MESVEKTTTFTVTDKWFTFSQEEAATLRDVILNYVEWETYKFGSQEKFFEALFDALADVEYPS